MIKSKNIFLNQDGENGQNDHVLEKIFSKKNGHDPCGKVWKSGETSSYEIPQQVRHVWRFSTAKNIFKPTLPFTFFKVGISWDK